MIRSLCDTDTKNTHSDQQNRRKSPELNPHSYTCLVFEKKCGKLTLGKKVASVTFVLGKQNNLQKNATRSKSLTLGRGTFKIDQDINARPEADNGVIELKN